MISLNKFLHFLLPIGIQRVIYTGAIHIYGFLIYLGAFKNQKAKQFLKGRKHIFQRLKEDIVLNENYIWFHCASLGEFEQGRPLIEKIRSELPHMRIVLTFFSPSGYEVRKDYEYADEIYYLPLDTKRNAYQFVNILRPKLTIFVKYDFWYHYLKNLAFFNVPTLLISASFKPDHVFFRNWAKLPREMLYCFTHIFVQDELSKSLLEGTGYSEVTKIPDTRIDRAYEITLNVSSFNSIEQFLDGNKTFVGGSTYEEEEEWLNQFVKDYDEPLKVILAPHDTHEERIKAIQNNLEFRAVRFSEIDKVPIDGTETFLIIDQVGLLSSLYQYGDLALIGGGFRKSIHNILEPATFGLPILFGPRFDKFNEAVDLVKLGGAFSMGSYEEFREKASQLLQESNNQQGGKICRNYIENNRGGTDKIFQFITEGLNIPEIRNSPKKRLDDLQR